MLDDKPFLRQSTCNQCRHGHPAHGGFDRSYCVLTKREGNAQRACYCQKYEQRLQQSSTEVSEQGFRYRSKQIEDYRTRRQWENAGYKVKDSAEGYVMHNYYGSNRTFVYFLPEDVEDASQE